MIRALLIGALVAGVGTTAFAGGSHGGKFHRISPFAQKYAYKSDFQHRRKVIIKRSSRVHAAPHRTQSRVTFKKHKRFRSRQLGVGPYNDSR